MKNTVFFNIFDIYMVFIFSISSILIFQWTAQ
jgi:hypothetical protein